MSTGGRKMRRLWEKSLILIFCLYNTFNINPHGNLVYCFLISIIFSIGLDLIKNDRMKIIIYISFLILCFYNTLFIFYIPLILYNMYMDFGIYSLIVLPFIFMDFSPVNLFFSIISTYLGAMTKKYNLLLQENKIVRDELKEDTLYLQKYNEQLKIDREKNIQIAILTERNRIARELHDSIGHGISSSILQVEALKFISTEDKVLRKLNTLQETLKRGMDDIRKSIHNLYNESLDLERQIEKLSNETPNLDIEFIYGIEGDLSYDLKFDILSVVREGITNCVKHSNASKMKISVLEQPKFYTIIIKDNGSNFSKDSMPSNKGIGLISIKEIAYKYNGFVNFKFDEGFKIHLTLMKGNGYDGYQAVKLYKKHKADLILMDIRMEGLNGIDATREILKIDPDARILLITTFQDDEYISSALSLGCKGYILKQNIKGIIPAINAVYSGNLVFDSKIVSNIKKYSRKDEIDIDLSERELDILLLVAEGLNNKEIAEKLFLSEGTVRNYISNMLDKLSLRDRTQLAVYYYKRKYGVEE